MLIMRTEPNLGWHLLSLPVETEDTSSLNGNFVSSDAEFDKNVCKL